LFCSFADNGRRAVVWSGRERGAEFDFFCREYEVQPPTVMQSSSTKLYPDPEPTFTLKMHRRDYVSPLTVVSVSLSELGSISPHKTAPIQSPVKHWLLASSARMSAIEVQLVPALPKAFWSVENVTWAASADGGNWAVVQRGRIQVVSSISPPPGIVDVSFPTTQYTFHLPQCSFSRDGRRLFFISARDLYALDLTEGLVEEVFSAEGGNLLAFCESPSGERLLGACQDGSLYLWRLDGSEEPRRFVGHDGDAIDCAFIDEDTLASIGNDGSLRIWSTQSDRHLAVFAAGTRMGAFAVSPAGRELVAADVGGQVYILQLMRRAQVTPP
jgi:WD40 repeat protein